MICFTPAFQEVIIKLSDENHATSHVWDFNNLKIYFNSFHLPFSHFLVNKKGFVVMSCDTLQLIESSILIASLKDDILKLWQEGTWYSSRVNMFSFYNWEYMVDLNYKIAQDFQFEDDREKSERKWVHNQSTCFSGNPNKRFI